MAVGVKQRLVAAARAAGVLPLLDAGRFAVSCASTFGENRRFLSVQPDFTPPPRWWMHDMYRHTSYGYYWDSGQKTAAALTERIEQYVGAQSPHVADWGCGLGRVIRYLPAHYERFGFDYNKNAIDWCVRHIPDVLFSVNGLFPPLDAKEDSFDALYALSVFTHLSAEAHDAWITEIERVLKPGGVLIAGFHLDAGATGLSASERAQINEGALVVRGGVKEGSRLYTAHHPIGYVKDHLLKEFEILEAPFSVFNQSLIAARLKG